MAVLWLGVPASTLGRYALSLYAGKFFGKVLKGSKQDEMKFVGRKLTDRLWKVWLFVLIYTLLPMSSTALFSGAAMARLRPYQILPPFFVGKFTSDAVMLLGSVYALHRTIRSPGDLVSAKGIITIVVGLILIGLFLFLDWRVLLERRQWRLNFHIWR